MMLWWIVAAVLVFASAEPDPQSVEIIGPQVHYGNVIEGRILQVPHASSARVVGPQVHYGDVIHDRVDTVYYDTPYHGVHRPVSNRVHSGAIGFRVSADLSDPCVPTPCGRNSGCRERAGRPVCECLPGYFGNAVSGCVAGECEISTDCPRNKKCENYKCVDPCIACGSGAECRVTQHIPVCYCPSGYTGDPHRHCRHLTEADICQPNPCGVNAICKAVNVKAQCRCAETYIGDPLRGCRHECDRDNECGHSEKCIDYKCQNPCIDHCGENAECNVVNHNAVCSCPEDFLGNPSVRCYPECVEHSACPRHLACFSFKCVDPCIGVCGVGAQCEVTNHKAICSCPPDWVGHPFERCEPFDIRDLCRPNPCGRDADCTPGKDRTGDDRPVCTCPEGFLGDPLVGCNRGDCLTHGDCADNRACVGYICEDPCSHRNEVCGINAECESKNHGAICRCPRGYTGQPLVQCTYDPQSTQPVNFRRGKRDAKYWPFV